MAGPCAATWSALFSAFSLYYAAGRTAGLDLQPLGIQDQAGTRAFTVVPWVAGALKLMTGGLAVALARPARRRLRRQAVLVAGWGYGCPVRLYGGTQRGVSSTAPSLYRDISAVPTWQ